MLEKRGLSPPSPKVSVFLQGCFLFSVVLVLVVVGPSGCLLFICCCFSGHCSLSLPGSISSAKS